MAARGALVVPLMRIDRTRVHNLADVRGFRQQPASVYQLGGIRSKNGKDPSPWSRERSRTVIGTRPGKACVGSTLEER